MGATGAATALCSVQTAGGVTRLVQAAMLVQAPRLPGQAETLVVASAAATGVATSLAARCLSHASSVLHLNAVILGPMLLTN